MTKRHRNSAFTLIELLIVLVIIATLAAIVVPKLVQRPGDARITAAKAQITNFKSELTIFQIDNGRLPTTEEGLAALTTNPADLPNWKQLSEDIPADPWGHAYVYHCPGPNGRDFEVYSTGPSGQDGGPDNIRL